MTRTKTNVFVLGFTQGYIQNNSKEAEGVDIFAVLTADTLNTESWILDTVALGGPHAAYILRKLSPSGGLVRTPGRFLPGGLSRSRWPGMSRWTPGWYLPEALSPSGRCVLLMRRTPHGAAWVGEVGLGNLYQGCSDPQPQVDFTRLVQCWVLHGPLVSLGLDLQVPIG